MTITYKYSNIWVHVNKIKWNQFYLTNWFFDFNKFTENESNEIIDRTYKISIKLIQSR